MFYKMISAARDRWYGSADCTVKSLVDYIIQTGQMRDAQVVAAAPAAQNTEITHAVKTQDFTQNVTGIVVDETERGDRLETFTGWLYNIAKSSFGYLSMTQVKEQEPILRGVFDTITYGKGGLHYYSSLFNHVLIEVNIRKAFYEKRGFTTSAEEIRRFISEDDSTSDKGEWHSDSEIKIDKLGYVIKRGEKTKRFRDSKNRCSKPPLRLKIRNICGDESELYILDAKKAGEAI